MGENFAFGFEDFDSDFSDCVLHLEVTPDDDTCGGDDDPTPPSKKLKVASDDSSSSDGAKVRNLRITSPILALKSPFFYKLFKNGMRESQHKNEISLKINASEEAPLMDLIRFMYGNHDLNATSFPALVELLIAADKFEVTSCMSHCVELLLKFPMSLESAMLYLELPLSVVVSDVVKPLIDAAKQFVAATYKDLTKSQDEVMHLPLSAIEAIIGSEGLQVASEDVVLDFVSKWARASYPELEERRGILIKHLVPLFYFQNMSVTKLKEVLACTDFDHECVSKLVIEALFYKVQLPCGQLLLSNEDSKDISTTECGSAGRVYNPHCVVFYDLTRKECSNLHSLYHQKIESSQFRLGKQVIFLMARCVRDADQLERFSLYAYKRIHESCIVDIEFAVMKKSSRQFETKFKVNNHTLEGIGCGKSNLLGITWTELMSDNSDYFINNVLHLRAEVTLKNFEA